jgi:hypothetical protein
MDRKFVTVFLISGGLLTWLAKDIFYSGWTGGHNEFSRIFAVAFYFVMLIPVPSLLIALLVCSFGKGK